MQTFTLTYLTCMLIVLILSIRKFKSNEFEKLYNNSDFVKIFNVSKEHFKHIAIFIALIFSPIVLMVKFYRLFKLPKI